ncbi:Lar family restriction alleviation protein [Bombella pollinis]|uniref:Lar family restriction alleviation protein n=1 Tax=Bombella pollinis TaxID=2967337 RepID=UPI003899558A
MTYRSSRPIGAHRRAVPFPNKSSSRQAEPCPFCQERLNIAIRNSVDGYYVNCMECGATGPYAPSSIEARVKWNVRTRQSAGR